MVYPAAQKCEEPESSVQPVSILDGVVIQGGSLPDRGGVLGPQDRSAFIALIVSGWPSADLGGGPFLFLEVYGPGAGLQSSCDLNPSGPQRGAAEKEWPSFLG
jgi:hypothetical protein